MNDRGNQKHARESRQYGENFSQHLQRGVSTEQAQFVDYRRIHPMDHRHKEHKHPSQLPVLFENVPDHFRLPFAYVRPSRAARASVVKMDRSTMGCASMPRTPSMRARIRSFRPFSSNRVSTNVSTRPMARISNHSLGI